MKTYRDWINSSTLNLSARWKQVVSLMAQELYQKTEKSFASAGYLTMVPQYKYATCIKS